MGLLHFVVLLWFLAQLVGGAAHGRVFGRGKLRRFAQRLERHAVLVDFLATSRQRPFADVAQEAAQVVGARKRRAGKHFLDSQPRLVEVGGQAVVHWLIAYPPAGTFANLPVTVPNGCELARLWPTALLLAT